MNIEGMLRTSQGARAATGLTSPGGSWTLNLSSGMAVWGDCVE
jgi:hypothetical protein